MTESSNGLKILIVGAAGMIGRKLTERLLADGRLGRRDIAELVLADVVMPPKPSCSIPVTTITGDLSEPGAAAALVGKRPDLIFHLAAIVSGEAEADFDKGYRINLDGTRLLFEALRKAEQPYRPRLVFTSSIAVFGAPFPERIGDDFLTAPLTSYGTQKAVCELLLSDYTRRGIGLLLQHHPRAAGRQGGGAAG
jgi:D-erythronate 2-dehydrogenase